MATFHTVRARACAHVLDLTGLGRIGCLFLQKYAHMRLGVISPTSLGRVVCGLQVAG